MWGNYIGIKKNLKIFYRKGTGILLEIISGNIKKEKSKSKEPDKGNKCHRVSTSGDNIQQSKYY